MSDLGRLALRQVALRIKDQPTTHRAVGTGVAGLSRSQKLPSADRCCVGRLDIAKAQRAERRPGKACAGAAHELTPRQFNIHGTVLLSMFTPSGTLFMQRSQRYRAAEFRN